VGSQDGDPAEHEAAEPDGLLTRPVSRPQFLRGAAGASLAGLAGLAGLDRVFTPAPARAAVEPSAQRKIEIAAYYFPQWHVDPRNETWHGAEWTEWRILQEATPRFPGHDQPKVPLWGYEDESDPAVMRKKIAAAADNGLDAFIFDWYWYDNATFLASALEKGFLKADNNRRLKFALMWADQDWWDLYPQKRARFQTPEPYEVQIPGATSLDSFRAMTDYVIDNYLGHPSYWTVDGGLYFSIYDLSTLQAGLGGPAEVKAALDDFRARARAAGRGDLHLNAVVTQFLPDANTLLDSMGFDSVTHYTWIHFEYDKFQGTTTPYSTIRRATEQDWPSFDQQFTLPYIPNVSAGWDASPRTAQTDTFDKIGYPFETILTGNSPEEFRAALHALREFLSRPGRQLSVATINAWNEWTEGSYLEPDKRDGYARLKALKDVFGRS
jgi:hypothetical protein